MIEQIRAPSVETSTAIPLPLPLPQGEGEEGTTREKVLAVVKRTFSSPLFWVSVKAVILATFVITVIASPLLVPASITLTIIGLGTLFLAIEIYLLRKPLRSELSLTWALAMNAINGEKYRWWEEIDESITLGALPLVNRGHVEELAEKGISAVLSVVEAFELDSKIFSVPARKEEWKEAGVAMKQFAAAKGEPLPLDLLDDAVEYLRVEIAEGKKVYVHSTTGRERSAMVVICYLMKYNPPKREDRVYETIGYVSSKSPQVNLDMEQIKVLIEYKKSYCSDDSA